MEEIIKKCDHRFINELIPTWKINHLFVGTFNPSWDKGNKNNAVYFYTRFTNDFWYIMPQVFGKGSLMPKEDRNNKEKLVGFLKENKIGITDMIKSLKKADYNIESDRKRVLSFLDDDLLHFEFEPTDIKTIIANNPNLKGIYLTRQFNGKENKLSELWTDIKKIAKEKKIKTAELITPSRAYHRIKRDDKINEWKTVIKL